MGVYGKLFAILEETGKIVKDMTIDMGGKGSYNAISEPQVIKIIRPLLVKYKLIAIPVRATVNSVQNGLTTIEYTYRIIDTEVPFDEVGSHVDVDTVGQGKSTADKGSGMASTYAFKYLWLRLFAMISGEDADNTSDYQHDKVAEQAATKYLAVIDKLNNLNRGGKLKNLDNYNRIKAAIESVKSNEKHLQLAENALDGITNGTQDPDKVAPNA